MIKWTSAEDDLAAKTKAKADKKKTKKLKKEVRNLTQDSVITKLREELELSKSRADHFEREFFDLKKSHEVLNDCYRTIADADQQLQAELYEMTKVISKKDETISEYEELTERSIDSFAKMSGENEALRIRIKELEPELTTEEVNDQINQILKKG